MAGLGLLILGAFVGYIIMHGVEHIKDWTKPTATLNGVLSAAVAGGLFALISNNAFNPPGDAIYCYPVGLGYGALCKGLAWTAQPPRDWLKVLHVLAFSAATVALLLLMFWERLRESLPTFP